MSTLVHFMTDESGATAFEYGLIAAAAGLAVSAIIPIFGNT
jgi:Flp pilus assembly pilin Flp